MWKCLGQGPWGSALTAIVTGVLRDGGRPRFGRLSTVTTSISSSSGGKIGKVNS